MLIKKLRLQRGWSQEHLSQVSGLSVRTIQRIERGQKAGLESLKSLAAVFELDISSLQQEVDMTTQASTADTDNKAGIQVTLEEQRAMEYVQGLKAFYGHLATYIIINIVLFAVNWLITPGYLWVLWVMMGWGIGLISHAVATFELFNFFDAEWEKRQIEKRLGRDL
ncbi:helix-turn-helix domain-containing protein [Thalassotalea euphylliae]|uniref:Helix-turn-helix domain-containing protein n=1 Tax=Thalassotalea euphylliae TaxID=1655234 RepID=A0A3E0TVQ1_9GAMM|nr:2TM domain-containing protein [Thalassotalea euphylliae]REL28668.1 helix-turn-helix domain-containing protein [Thalassotalea euphylliae]